MFGCNSLGPDFDPIMLLRPGGVEMRDGSFNYGADYENKIDVSNS